MNLAFANKKLEALYVEERNYFDLSSKVTATFFYHTAAIAAAKDKNDLLKLQSLPIRGEDDTFIIDLGEDWGLGLSFDTFPAKAVLLSLTNATWGIN